MTNFRQKSGLYLFKISRCKFFKILSIQIFKMNQKTIEFEVYLFNWRFSKPNVNIFKVNFKFFTCKFLILNFRWKFPKLSSFSFKAVNFLVDFWHILKKMAEFHIKNMSSFWNNLWIEVIENTKEKFVAFQTLKKFSFNIIYIFLNKILKIQERFLKFTIYN